MTLLRVSTAGLMLVHGVARTSFGTVDDFGVGLTAWGFPFGPAIAWAITIVEILGGLCLALGIFVRPLAVWFIVQLISGVILIHSKEGWFVVGAGRNGMEYSVLLILAFVSSILADGVAYRVLKGGGIGGRPLA